MLAIWLSLSPALGQQPEERAEETDEEPDEEMIIYDVAAARELLDDELDHMGYIRKRRRGDKTIYRNRQRWKPTVIIHDSGWMELNSPAVRPRMTLIPPLLIVSGSITSKRKIEAQKTKIVEQTAPLMRIYRDAIASEAAWDEGYEAPGFALPEPDAGDVVRGLIGLTTGADPVELAENPLLGRIGNHGFPDPDQEMAFSAYLATIYTLSGALTPTVRDALVATPRHTFLPQTLWDIAGEDRPITTDEGRMAAPGEVAWQLSVAEPQPGERVLEISSALGWRVAVLEAMGAEVVRAGSGPFDLILVEEGLRIPAELLAEGGRILVLGQGHITLIADGETREILMVR